MPNESDYAWTPYWHVGCTVGDLGKTHVVPESPTPNQVVFGEAFCMVIEVAPAGTVTKGVREKCSVDQDTPAIWARCRCRKCNS